MNLNLGCPRTLRLDYVGIGSRDTDKDREVFLDSTGCRTEQQHLQSDI
jgi:hypothetical protein